MARFEYTNTKGKIIPLTPTAHAVDNFIRRWNRLHPDKRMLPEKAETKMAELFGRAFRVWNLSKQEERRRRRHTRDTLFFRTDEFRFVVQNQHIVTVEISTREKKHLNRPRRRLSDLLEET